MYNRELNNILKTNNLHDTYLNEAVCYAAGSLTTMLKNGVTIDSNDAWVKEVCSKAPKVLTSKIDKIVCASINCILLQHIIIFGIKFIRLARRLIQ